MSIGTLIVRVDASVALGTGHVMRCLAVAQAWQDAGGACVFAMREVTAATEERVRSEGIKVALLQVPAGSVQDAAQLVELTRAESASWVIMDGYHFDDEYQRVLKRAGIKLLFVDDFGHARHYFADLVLNQNVQASETLYGEREPHTILLLGPRYAMLRREFESWREWRRDVPSAGHRVLVTLGGSDPENVTAIVIHALGMMQVVGLEAAVVVGGSNPHSESLERAASPFSGILRLRRSVSSMGELMAWADAAVSAAGSTCWEMCLLGLPAILIDLAENQRPVAQELGRKGLAIHLGSTRDVTPQKIADELTSMLASPQLRAAISRRERELVDGRGAHRVVHAMLRASEPNCGRDIE